MRQVIRLDGDYKILYWSKLDFVRENNIMLLQILYIRVWCFVSELLKVNSHNLSMPLHKIFSVSTYPRTTDWYNYRKHLVMLSITFFHVISFINMILRTFSFIRMWRKNICIVKLNTDSFIVNRNVIHTYSIWLHKKYTD